MHSRKPSVSAQSRAGLQPPICFQPLGWRLFRKTLNDCVRNQSVAGGGVMAIAEDEKLRVPASRLALRALLLCRQESWKHTDKALALALAPLAKDLYLPGIGRVVGHLRQMRVNHDAEGDVSLLQFLPKESHLGHLFGNSALHSKRSIAGGEGDGFIDPAIGPG